MEDVAIECWVVLVAVPKSAEVLALYTDSFFHAAAKLLSDDGVIVTQARAHAHSHTYAYAHARTHAHHMHFAATVLPVSSFICQGIWIMPSWHSVRPISICP